MNHPNITVLEHKDYNVLPYYLSQFDLALIPFRLTELVKACDPVKYYEYLSAGKPILATDIYEIKRRYSDLTYFINKENCFRTIEKAIKEDSMVIKKRRMETAQLNSWQERAKTVIRSIRNHL